jgi:integrase
MSKELKAEIKDALKTARPNLGDGSIATYTSLLNSLAKKMGAESLAQLKNLKEKNVMEYIDGMSNMSSQKTVLSSLVLITQNEAYQKRMISYADQVNAQYRKQTVSEHRKESYITFQEVKARFVQIEAKLKQSPTPQAYVDNLIYRLMSGIFYSPRRLEWADVKIRNYDKAIDNYLEKDVVTFNNYKTRKTYGVQMVKLDKPTMVVIRKWTKMNDTDYLLATKTGKKMSSSALSTRIGQINGDPKFGVDIWRSIFVTDLLSGKQPPMEVLDRVANEMGHSLTMQMQYRKIDAPTTDEE